MPRATRGPKLKKGTREYFVVVRGIPPQPLTEKPPPGLLMKAAKDFAEALSRQYGHAAVYTTEPRNVRLSGKRKGGNSDPYTWPDWRWRLVITYRAPWYNEARGLLTSDMSVRPDATGNPASIPRYYPPPIQLAGPPHPGYVPRPLLPRR